MIGDDGDKIGTGAGTTPDDANQSDPQFTDSVLGLYAEHELFTVFHSGLVRLTPAGQHRYADALAAMEGSREPDAEVKIAVNVKVENEAETGTVTEARAWATVNANEETFKRLDSWTAYPINQMLALISEGEKRDARNAQRNGSPIVSWGPLVDALHDRLADALLIEKDVDKAAQLVERCKTMIEHIERVRDGIDPKQTAAALERARK
jgi:hypothetical protein